MLIDRHTRMSGRRETEQPKPINKIIEKARATQRNKSLALSIDQRFSSIIIDQFLAQTQCQKIQRNR
ncbi:hypothetical protein ABF87_03420 [Nitrosomonas sp. JL21]|nr:hypothetical protein [Nitrosomonas sp. JL21]